MKRFLKASIWIVGVFLMMCVLYTLFMAWTRFAPPDIHIPPVAKVQMLNGKAVLPLEGDMRKVSARTWLAPVGKIWEMHLGGGPVELGMAQSLLSSFLMKEQEAYFIDQLKRYIPSRLIQRILKIY
ncbi:MAG: hypothetical protein P8Y09_08585, partial [Deltaproteobacteria bacterium]